VRRQLHFQREIDTFHRAWRDFFDSKILNGIAIAPADLERIPRFAWEEEDPAVVRAGIVTGLLQLLIPAAALAVLGAWRLRRYAVV
jgi:ABC-2 type transport system permease protein